LILAAAGAAGWFFFIRPDEKPNSQTAATPTTEVSGDVTSDVPEATNTESFTSSPYRVTLGYPKTWTVTENNDNSLLIQSKGFSYKTADGQTKNGNFRVYIRKGGQKSDSDIIAKGVAIQASTKLTYTKPTAAQRKETNLS